MPTLKTRMRRNVKLVYILRMRTMFMISIATIVPYWNDLGLSQFKISVLQSVFLISTLLLELPSGYFADTFGRKNSLVIGAIIGTLGWGYYSFAGGFVELVIAELLLGFGASFKSGADESLLYDSLKAIGDEDDNLNQDSRSTAFGTYAEGFAGLIGGGLAVSSLWLPVFAQSIWMVATLPVVFWLSEPPIHQTSAVPTNPLKAIARITHMTLHGNKVVKWLVLYAGIMATSTYTMVWLMQPYYTSVGIPLSAFGLLWFGKHLVLGTVGLKVASFKRRLGLDRGLVLLPVVSVVTYLVLGAGYSIWVVPAMLGFELVRGVGRPLTNDEINKEIPSDIRATVNSVKELVRMLMFVIFVLITGWISDTYGLRATMFASAGIYGLFGGLALLGMYKNKLIFSERR